MDAFLEVFGDITVATVVLIITALVFVWKIYSIIKDHLIAKKKKSGKFRRLLNKRRITLSGTSRALIFKRSSLTLFLRLKRLNTITSKDYISSEK